jgi:hypothetical protein
MNDRPKTPGQVAFDAYNNHGPNAGKTYDGKPIPPWGEIAEHTRERWEVAAKATIHVFMVSRDADIGIGDDPPPPPPPPG